MTAKPMKTLELQLSNDHAQYHLLAYLSDRLSRNAQSDWLHRCRLSIDRRQFVRARAIEHASLHKYIKIYEM